MHSYTPLICIHAHVNYFVPKFSFCLLFSLNNTWNQWIYASCELGLWTTNNDQLKYCMKFVEGPRPCKVIYIFYFHTLTYDFTSKRLTCLGNSEIVSLESFKKVRLVNMIIWENWLEGNGKVNMNSILVPSFIFEFLLAIPMAYRLYEFWLTLHKRDCRCIKFFTTPGKHYWMFKDNVECSRQETVMSHKASEEEP